MNTTPSAGNLFVWVGDNTACVRITGRANFTTSVDFKKLMQHFRGTGQAKVVLDLSECLLMDSTFLGVLANEAKTRSATKDGHTEPGVELVNPNQRIRDLLDNLGVVSLFNVVQCEASKETFEPVQPAEGISREEITRTCLDAHLALMELSPGNVPKFKDVTHFFAENLKKLQDESLKSSPQQ
ncbi:MAG: STAS domain-containing protein [Verrucomicrobia bacterium]|nr:STAS domain-containing protein [Verrucomicrobiota bacterium]